MPLYLIDGPSGSGKSTLGRLLASWGQRVRDLDRAPGLCGWEGPEGLIPAAELPCPPAEREWLEQHRWIWIPARMESLIERERKHGQPVFFVGGAANSPGFADRFELHFGLHARPEILKQRLQAREPGRWQDGSFELERMLERSRSWPARASERGIILIESDAGIEQAAEEILRRVGLHARTNEAPPERGLFH